MLLLMLLLLIHYCQRTMNALIDRRVNDAGDGDAEKMQPQQLRQWRP